MRRFLTISLMTILCISYSNISNAQRGTRVGYIDMDIILESVEEYNKASLLLDKSIEKWKKEIELKKIQLKQFQDQLNIERILLTPELIKDRELEIQDFAFEIGSWFQFIGELQMTDTKVCQLRIVIISTSRN